MAYDPDLQPVLEALQTSAADADRKATQAASAAANAAATASQAERDAQAAQAGLFLLEARVAKLEKVPVPPPDPEPPKVERFEAVDFAKSSAGFFYPDGGTIAGNGADFTTYAIKPGSSTKTPPTSGTDPNRIMRAGQFGGADQGGIVVRDLTIEGYAGHNSHGLTVGYSKDAIVSGVNAIGVRGTGSTPPAETFSIELWQAFNPTIADCFIDGQDNAGTLLGLNSVEQGRVERLKATGTVKAFGIATWQSGSGDKDRPLMYSLPDLRGNRRAFNFEQCYGYIYVDRPDLRDRRSLTNPDIVVASAGNYTPNRGPMAGKPQTSGVTSIIIYEPVWDRDRGRPLTIGVPNIGGDYTAGKGKHAQAIAAVTVVIDGKAYSGAQNNSLVRIGNFWG